MPVIASGFWKKICAAGSGMNTTLLLYSFSPASNTATTL